MLRNTVEDLILLPNFKAAGTRIPTAPARIKDIPAYLVRKLRLKKKAEIISSVYMGGFLKYPAKSTKPIRQRARKRGSLCNHA
jgi:hypothetical protein